MAGIEKDLTIELPMDAPANISLLEIRDVSVGAQNLVIDGNNVGGSIGVQIGGSNSSDSSITRCSIQSLANGVRRCGSNANVSRNVFQNIDEYAVFISSPGGLFGCGVGDEIIVGPSGDDDLGDGTSESPYLTIAKGLEVAGSMATENEPVAVLVDTGTYAEAVTLEPGIRLEGAGGNRPIIKPESAQLLGGRPVVEAANGATIRSFEIELPDSAPTSSILVQIQNVNTYVNRVDFDGRAIPNALGASVSGIVSSESLISDCTFSNLDTGVRILDSGIQVTRSIFDRILGDALFVVELDFSEVAPDLGEFNFFKNVVGNFIT